MNTCDAGPAVAIDGAGRATALRHIPPYRDVMQRTATKHKQMPDAVPVSITFVIQIKNDADGIDRAAGNNPKKTMPRQRRD